MPNREPSSYRPKTEMTQHGDQPSEPVPKRVSGLGGAADTEETFTE